MQPQNIGDFNIERLVGASYKPELPDPAFVAKVEARLQAAAARHPAPMPPAELERLRKIRRRLGWGMAFAACAAAVVLILHALDRPQRPTKTQDNNEVVNQPNAINGIPVSNNESYGLKPRPRNAALPEPKIAVGADLKTKPGERRRVTLADGSVLYLNAETEATYVGDRQIKLTKGEVYVEVAPLSPPRGEGSGVKQSPLSPPRGEGLGVRGTTFTVTAPGREVRALGTHFTVWADGNQSGVAVTQGKVEITGLEGLVHAGQQLSPNGIFPEPALRATHQLDWTRELMAAAETPLVPRSQHAGGSLVAVDPSGQETKLTMRQYHVDVHIEDGFARTTIDQTYFNETYGRLEGTFYFPLPPDATLSRLAMYVKEPKGDKCQLMEGGMAERDHARNVFETVLHMRRDPALLEWVDGSTFKMRVFPLEPREEKRLILSYTQKLPTLYGNVQYRFPAGHSLSAVGEWSFEARVKDGNQLHCFSPSHPKIKIKTDGLDMVLSLHEKNAFLKQDVTLGIVDNTKAGQEELVQFTSYGHEGSQYLMLRYRPALRKENEAPKGKEHSAVTPLPASGRGAGGEGSAGANALPASEASNPVPPLPASGRGVGGEGSAGASVVPPLPASGRGVGGEGSRHWLFLYESSANRDPLVARAQIDIIKGLLENVEHHDTFTIIAANTRVHFFDKTARHATPENIQQALQWLENVQLIGALDLGQALTAIEPILKSAKNPHLVHIGAAVASIGQRNDAALVNKIPQTTPYIGIGVGKQWNRTFMKLAADRTGGYFTQINPDEPINWRAFELLATLNTPRLEVAEVRSQKSEVGGQKSEVKFSPFLMDATTIAQGEELCAVTRIDFTKKDPFPETVVIRGKVAGKECVKELKVQHIVHNAGYLPRQWAKLELDRLLAEDADKNKPAIIALSKASYVMSPYTSLLVLETEADYVTYKVDRGRKDHWAMYPCPDKIPVVQEWNGRQQQPAKVECDEDKILPTILVRTGPQFANWAIATPFPLSRPSLIPPPSPEQSSEKTFPFQFESEPWSNVLDWLKNITGLQFLGTEVPTGSLTIRPPLQNGKPPQYTVAEIIDILNDVLLPQKMLILRRQASMMIWPADNPLPLELVRHVGADALGVPDGPMPSSGSGSGVAPPKSGGQRLAKTEFVRINLQLTHMQADIFAPAVKRMMGPFGQVIPLEEANQLILIDSVGNLREIVKAVNAVENNTLSGSRQSVDPKYVEHSLDVILGRRPTTTVGFPFQSYATLLATKASKFQGEIGKGPRLPVQSNTLAQAVATAAKNMGIDSRDTATMAELVRVLTTNSNSPADFEVIPLGNANAAQTASILDSLFNGPGFAAFHGIGGGKVGGSPFLGGGKGGGKGGGGKGLADLIGGFFQGTGGNADALQGIGGADVGGKNRVERIRVVADPATNKLLVWASPLDMLIIHDLLEKSLSNSVSATNSMLDFRLGELGKLAIPGPPGPFGTRTIVLDKAGAATLAAALQKAWPSINPITLEVKKLIDTSAFKSADGKLNQFPQPQPGRLDGAPELKIYSVPAGNARITAQMLNDIYKSSPSFRIQATSDTQIMVYAPVADQFDIAKHISPAFAPRDRTAVIVLKDAKANTIADYLLDRFSGMPGAPMIKADMSKNAIIIIGSADQVENTKNMITELVGEALPAIQNLQGPDGINTFVIQLADASAAKIAEYLNDLQRSSPVITADKEKNAIIVVGTFQEFLNVKKMVMELAGPGGIDARNATDFKFNPDPRLFGDLLSYAPGMNTSLADIQAVLEAEATIHPPAKSGAIDPAARKLIDKARSLGWQKLTIDADGRQPGFVVHFNAAGQFCFDRVLPSGLNERVICDGKTLWHLYPEIGLGAKRPVSRFHRAELHALVPWLVPCATDLAEGADIRLVDHSTVAVVPMGADKAVDAAGKPRPFVQVNLTFAPDGRLAEQSTVLMPAKIVLNCQRYETDGTVKLLDPTTRKTLSKVKLPVTAATPPDLQPNVKDLVVVPMPLRTVSHLWTNANGRGIVDLDEDTALSLLAADCVGDDYAQRNAKELIARRFFAKSDHRLGFYVLLASANIPIDPREPYVTLGNNGDFTFDVVADHQRAPLAFYLAHHFKSLGKAAKANEIGDLDGPADGFIQRLAKFHDLWFTWQTGKALKGIEADRDRQRLQTLQFLGKSPLPIYDWVLLTAMTRHGVGNDPRVQALLADAPKLFTDDLGLSFSARYEIALGHFQSDQASSWAAGREQFRKLYLDTLEAGFLPPLDPSFREAFSTAIPGEKGFSALLQDAASILAKRGQRLDIVTLAWQAQQIGEQEIAGALLAQAVAVCEPGEERGLAQLAAVQFYRQTKQIAQAETTLHEVLALKPFKDNPQLWRLAGDLAAERKQPAKVLASIDTALNLEFQDLPATVNIQEIRTQYGNLLRQYQDMATAFQLLEKEPSKDFVIKVVRAADHWRSLDPDPTEVCQLTAKILQTVGAYDLAWDYLTTPIALKPNDAAAWAKMAKALAAEGNLDFADRAYTLAFETEPTNAQILWDRAANLLQAGRAADARAVYQILANGDWQPRWQWLQAEAKRKLESR